MKPLTLIILTLFLFLKLSSCSNGQENNNQTKLLDTESVVADTIEMSDNPENIYCKNDTVIGKYRITKEKISREVFRNAYKKYYRESDSIPKITDAKEAIRLLNGIVSFDTKDDSINPLISEIRTKSGKILKLDDAYSYFIAYYPTEQILLCEGEHASDVLFNLKTGEGDYYNSNRNQKSNLVGDPQTYIFSPDKKFRLSYFSTGQECCVYIIDVKNAQNKYANLIAFEDFFDWETCTMFDTFWDDQNKLYYNIHNYEETSENYTVEYYCITIREQ